MRGRKIIVGAFVAAATASAVRAEQWIDIGTNSAIRPELQSGFSFCIDKDSVKTDDLGWTSYTFKLCNEPREIFEASVQCAQNLSADRVPIRQRTLVANGKSTPDQPWKTDLTYTSSVSGKLAKFACSQPHRAAAAPAPKPGTMAAEVLAHLEATKGYRELSALYNKKVAADSHWPQSAEGRAVDAQLKNWRRDAGATVIVDGKEGRFLRYSVGGVTVTDAGVAVADLEKSLPYKRTIAEAIAQNILTSPVDPKVQAALATAASVPVAARDTFCAQIRAIVADAPNSFAAFKGQLTKQETSSVPPPTMVDHFAARGAPEGATTCEIRVRHTATEAGLYLPNYSCAFPIAGADKGAATHRLANRVAACLPGISRPIGPGLKKDGGMLDAHSSDYSLSYFFLSGPATQTITFSIQNGRK